MSEGASPRYSTKHRLNEIILAMASHERGVGTTSTDREKLCAYTKIAYQSIGVYLSWLRKLQLITISNPGRRGRKRQTYMLTEWGNKVADGTARIFVYYDFVWLRMESKVLFYFQYRKAQRTRDIRPEVEEYLKSGGTMTMPDVSEKPDPLPKAAPIQARMPQVVIVPPPTYTVPPAVVSVVLVANPAQELNKAMTPSTVRQPSREMLMGGRAPRRWKGDPL